uniref:Uncharacterized protein n=1 Tax=Myoviridae sp. ctegP15 TaxID=2825146 RepID=A0A8S5P3T5_9CAUD|nr:MAG TPA: hypothetical protein [Myoviridae sp. ctegP15]
MGTRREHFMVQVLRDCDGARLHGGNRSERRCRVTNYKRMWMFLEEEIEEEAEERDSVLLDTLLAHMELMEKFEMNGALDGCRLRRFHRDVICDYVSAWNRLKAQIEELLERDDFAPIALIIGLMDGIEAIGGAE